MYAQMKTRVFIGKELHGKTLEIKNFKSDNGTILTIGRDIKTQEIFILYEEWEIQNKENTGKSI